MYDIKHRTSITQYFNYTYGTKNNDCFYINWPSLVNTIFYNIILVNNYYYYSATSN